MNNNWLWTSRLFYSEHNAFIVQLFLSNSKYYTEMIVEMSQSNWGISLIQQKELRIEQTTLRLATCPCKTEQNTMRSANKIF